MFNDGVVMTTSGVAGVERIAAMETLIRRASSKSLALAALYICQSILLELEASGQMTDQQVQGLLKDAFRTLRQAGDITESEDSFIASEIVEAIRSNHERLRR